jgi:hypothetical protein
VEGAKYLRRVASRCAVSGGRVRDAQKWSLVCAGRLARVAPGHVQGLATRLAWRHRRGLTRCATTMRVMGLSVNFDRQSRNSRRGS